MTYWKSLLLNFFLVFFLNHVLPGIDVVQESKLPHIGGDLLFCIIVGLLNSLIYPVLRALNRKIDAMRIALCALGISFIGYALLKIAPVGVELMSIEGYFIASFLVALCSFLTNYFELRRHNHQAAQLPPH